jgi:hypothetical protein
MAAQTSAPAPIEVSKLGPQVGERVPAVSLPGQGSNRRNAVAATRISSGQLEATAYTSDAVVAAGNRFTLLLEVIPKPGMHVYAPGAKGYRAIGFEIAPSPYLRVEKTRYPASELYHFKPLDERVPVFQKPFVLSREVVLDGQLATQRALRGQEALTISGSLKYQACDDSVCYNPASVPLSWTIGLKGLVTGARPARPAQPSR